MAASNETAVNIVTVILKYMSRENALKMVADLKAIHGNKSFKETMAKIHQELVVHRG